MLDQYKDFNVKQFMKTFYGNPGYDGNINGFDIMIMESAELADKIIEELKYQIDAATATILEYDDEGLLPEDKERIKREIEEYSLSRGIILR